MALDRNQIFYYDFQGDEGGYYRLQFIPSDNSDLSSPTETQLYVGLHEIKVDCGYPDGIPYGMQKAPELSLKIDMSQITDNDLKTAIKEGAGVSKTIWGSVSKTIPNQWKILKSTDSGSTYTIIEFWGCQNTTPALKDSINQGITLENIEIKATDLFHKVTQDITPTFDNLDESNLSTTTDTHVTYYTKYDYGGKTYVIVKDRRVDAGTYLLNKRSTIQDFFDFIEGEILIYLKAYTRDGSLTINTDISKAFTQSDANPLWYWYIFEQDESSESYQRGSQLTNLTDVYLMSVSEIFVTGENGYGYFAESNENGLAEYSSLKDALSNMAEGTGGKLFIDYNPDTDNISYVFHRLRDRILDSAQITLTPDIIIDNIDLEYNFQITNEATSHYKSMGESDVNEYIYKSNKTLSQDSFEISCPFQTSYPVIASPYKKSWGTNYQFWIETLLDRNLYYITGTNPILVHDNIRIYYDGSDYTEGTAATIDKPITTKWADWYKEWNRYVKAVSRVSGSGYIVAKHLVNEYSKIGQSKISAKIYKDKAEGYMVGDQYVFDISDFTTDNYYSKMSTECYLVGTKIDYKTEIAEVEFFVKGV